MSSRIEQVIEEIEEYIEGCKYQTLSNTKIIVNKEELEELLTELRLRTPDEIKRYQKIISNKEAILADAKSKAESIVAQAQVQNTELVSEHQIMQQAYAEADAIVRQAEQQAQEIVDRATMDANNIRMYAIQYTDNMLKDLGNIIGHSIDSTKARSENLLTSLQGCYDMVIANRNELMPLAEEESAMQQQPAEEPPEQG